MAYIRYDKEWRSEFYNNVSAKNRAQCKNLSQLKVEVNEICKIDESLITNFEPSNDKYVVNKVYLDTKSTELTCLFSFREKDYIDFKGHLGIRANRFFESAIVLIQLAVTTTSQTFYDKYFFK